MANRPTSNKPVLAKSVSTYVSNNIMDAIEAIQEGENIAEFDADNMIERPDDINEDDVEALTGLEFAQEIKILLIPSASWRVVCSFLGFDSVAGVKSAPYSNITLIGLLVQQNAMAYLEKNGYKFQGEINFDNNEQPIPCSKHCWLLNDQEISFTSGGYLFFKNTKSEDRNDNLVIYAWRSSQDGIAGFHVYSNSPEKSKNICQKIEFCSFAIGPTQSCMNAIAVLCIRRLSRMLGM